MPKEEWSAVTQELVKAFPARNRQVGHQPIQVEAGLLVGPR